MEPKIVGLAPKTSVFRCFSRFEASNSWKFSKYILLRLQNLWHPSKSWVNLQEYQNHHWSPNGRPRKCTFCPNDREIDWTDVTFLLLTINVRSYMIIWCRSASWSINDHRQKKPKKSCATRDSSPARRPFSAINWLALLQSLFCCKGRPNQKAPFRSYKSKIHDIQVMKLLSSWQLRPLILSGQSEAKGHELQIKRKWIFVTHGFIVIIAIKAIQCHKPTLKLTKIL